MRVVSVWTHHTSVVSGARGQSDASCTHTLCQWRMPRIPSTAESALACPPCSVRARGGVCRSAHAHSGAPFHTLTGDTTFSPALRAPEECDARSYSFLFCYPSVRYGGQHAGRGHQDGA